MEPKIIATLISRLNETVKEINTLYDITETERMYLIHIVMECSKMGLSPKLIARLLKAAAHFIEASDEITKDIYLNEKEK